MHFYAYFFFFLEKHAEMISISSRNDYKKSKKKNKYKQKIEQININKRKIDRNYQVDLIKLIRKKFRIR